MKKILLISILLLVLIPSIGQAVDNMKAFPPTEKCMVRYVLNLEPQADESAFKVELLVGKVVYIDSNNRYHFGGQIEREVIQGWGYPLYKLQKLGPMAGTLMAVDPNAPKIDRFITITSPPELIRYNSRLPIVVYLPVGVEVRYRIWRADKEDKTIQKG